MVIDTKRTAPYAPLANVVDLIRRRRDKGLPGTLNAQELTRVGIPEGNISRTLQALRFLGLIDESGEQTETFNRLARTTTSEYPEILGEIIKSAYNDIFAIVDPGDATDIEINDAFRGYQPQAQRNRMIILFRGLCQEAQIIKGGPPETRKRERTVTSKPSPSSIPTRKPQPKSETLQFTSPSPSEGKSSNNSHSEYPLLEGLLHQLPEEKQWTQARREKWLQAVEATVDLLIDVVEQQPTYEM